MRTKQQAKNKTNIEDDENMNEHGNQEFGVFKLKRINQLIIKRLQESKNERKRHIQNEKNQCTTKNGLKLPFR